MLVGIMAGSALAPQQLTFRKDDHTWVFRYRPEDKQRIIDEIKATAADPNSGLDHCDALVLTELLESDSKETEGTLPPIPKI